MGNNRDMNSLLTNKITMFAKRITEHGQITDLSNGFNRGGEPFVLLVKPKGENPPVTVEINCKLICDRAKTPLAFPLDQWSDAVVVEIASNSLDLTEYDLFWGSLRD